METFKLIPILPSVALLLISTLLLLLLLSNLFLSSSASTYLLSTVSLFVHIVPFNYSLIFDDDEAVGFPFGVDMTDAVLDVNSTVVIYGYYSMKEKTKKTLH